MIRRLVDKYPNQMQLATTAKGEAGVHNCLPNGSVAGYFYLEHKRKSVEKLQMLRREGTLFGKSGEQLETVACCNQDFRYCSSRTVTSTHLRDKRSGTH